MRAAAAPPPAPAPTTDPAWLDDIKGEVSAAPTVDDVKAAWAQAKVKEAERAVAPADMATLSKLVAARLDLLRTVGAKERAATAVAQDQAERPATVA